MYQWQISSTETQGFTNIIGATNVSYTLGSTQEQVGKYIRVIVLSTDFLGGTSTVISNASLIANTEDEATGVLSISGTIEEGSLLTANTSNISDEDGNIAQYTYQWEF